MVYTNIETAYYNTQKAGNSMSNEVARRDADSTQDQVLIDNGVNGEVLTMVNGIASFAPIEYDAYISTLAELEAAAADASGNFDDTLILRYYITNPDIDKAGALTIISNGQKEFYGEGFKANSINFDISSPPNTGAPKITRVKFYNNFASTNTINVNGEAEDVGISDEVSIIVDIQTLSSRGGSGLSMTIYNKISNDKTNYSEILGDFLTIAAVGSGTSSQIDWSGELPELKHVDALGNVRYKGIIPSNIHPGFKQVITGVSTTRYENGNEGIMQIAGGYYSNNPQGFVALQTLTTLMYTTLGFSKFEIRESTFVPASIGDPVNTFNPVAPS